MLIYIVAILLNFKFITSKSILSNLQNTPPKIQYFERSFDEIKSPFENSMDGYEWENSGLFEGDILVLDSGRNGLIDEHSLWPNATIPFFIQDSHFNDDEIKTILEAINEYHTKTCLRFKPYESSDENWIEITGKIGGCWSSVGMKNEGGQQLNVNAPICVKKGVVIHEMLHAAGFYHQQSAADRDEYIDIMWENIRPERASNFRKYNSSILTDFSIGYDYQSLMHYGSKSFSKNGKETIVSKNKNITQLGQREGFTEKDILKLNRMYEGSCHRPTEAGVKFDENNLAGWFQSLFTLN